MVHMTSELRGEEDPLARVQTALFCAKAEVTSEENDKPAALWSLTWRMAPGSAAPSNECPKNLKIVSGPDSGIDFDASVAQVRRDCLACVLSERANYETWACLDQFF